MNHKKRISILNILIFIPSLPLRLLDFLLIKKLVVPLLQNKKISELVKFTTILLIAVNLLLALLAITGMLLISDQTKKIQDTLITTQTSMHFMNSVIKFVNVTDNIDARISITGNNKLIRSGDLPLKPNYDEVVNVANEFITVQNNFENLKNALEKAGFAESSRSTAKIEEILKTVESYKESLTNSGDGFFLTMMAGELETMMPYASVLDNDLSDKYVKKATEDANRISNTISLIIVTIILIGLIGAVIITRAALESMVGISSKVHASARESSEGAMTTANSANKMADTMSQLKLAISEIGSALSQVTHGSSSSAAAAEKITILVDNVANIMENLSMQAEETVKALRNSHGLINQSGINVTNSSAVIANTLVQINENVKIAGQVTKTVNDLSKQIEEVDTILHTIGHITDQTNLLSLNATIEAARAGEHGRGFAVVAERIRKLSSESADAAERIRDIISGIQKATNNVVLSMDKTITGVRSAAEDVADVSRVFQDLQNTFQEVLSTNDLAVQNAQSQAEATNKVLMTTKEVVSAVEQISAQLEETSASMEELSAEVEEITATSEDILNSIQQAASIARNQATLAKDVTDRMSFLT